MFSAMRKHDQSRITVALKQFQKRPECKEGSYELKV